MRAYVKPELFYENFELAQNIAACGWDWVTNTDKGNCYALGDINQGQHALKLFVSAPTCEATEDSVDSYCYEPSTGANGLFQS